MGVRQTCCISDQQDAVVNKIAFCLTVDEIGSTNRRADPVLIEEMRRFSQVSSLDEQPIPELNSEAIDFRAASEYFRPIRKLTRHELET